MDLSDYETRRKIQNREAQRRYRQKQKQRASPSINGGGSSNKSSTIVGSATASSTNLPSGNGMQRTVDVDFSDLFQSSALSLGTLAPGIVSPMASGNNNFDDLSVVSEGYPSHSTRSERHDYHQLASNASSSSSCPRTHDDSLPKRHDLILTKAGHMVHDLDRLYEFGVDMQLVTPNGELKKSLAHIERLFYESIYKSAEAWDE